MNLGSLGGAGVDGYYWASPAYPSTLSAYNLSFNSANVFPSTYSARWYGFTVHARQESSAALDNEPFRHQFHF